MKETLGQRLHRLRLATGLTQQQLADGAGVPVTTLRGWEVDRREPGFRAAVRLAKALGVSVEELAQTVPVEEVGKVPRPAGPSKPPHAKKDVEVSKPAKKDADVVKPAPAKKTESQGDTAAPKKIRRGSK